MRFLIVGLLCQLVEASPLVEAAHEDDLATVKELVAGGAKVEEGNRYGVTALALACENGSGEMVKFLLEKGADANGELAGGETMLMRAARTGVLDVVKALVEAGAKVKQKEERGQTALMWAAAEGHVEVVGYLIEKGAEVDGVLDDGFTALLYAVREGHGEVVRVLVKAGAGVNEVAKPKKPGRKRLRTGSGPLMVAVENGHFELALELVKAGADANDLRSGSGPLHALTWVRKSVKGDGDDGLPTPKGSGMVGSLDFVRELVKLGGDVDLKLEGGRGGVARVDRKGATAFLLAAETGDVELLEVLLEVGADGAMGNHRGTVPLLAAAGMGVTAPGEEAADVESAMATVKFLVEKGADINVKDQRGETVMHAAAYKSAPKMIRLLDELGADIGVWNQKNRAGWTPLVITQGFRPGNFRPIEKTERVLVEVMKKYGAEIPPAPKRVKKKGYEAP